MVCLESGGIGPILAEIVEQVAFDEATECEDIGGSVSEPSHSGKFGALSNDVTTSALDGARPDEVTITTKGAISHTAGVLLEI